MHARAPICVCKMWNISYWWLVYLAYDAIHRTLFHSNKNARVCIRMLCALHFIVVCCCRVFCGIESSFNNKTNTKNPFFFFSSAFQCSVCRSCKQRKVNQANINRSSNSSSSITLLPRCRCTNKSIFWFTTNRWSLALHLSMFSRLKTYLFAFAISNGFCV